MQVLIFGSSVSFITLRLRRSLALHPLNGRGNEGQVRLTVRNIWISMSEAYLYAEVFALVHRHLQVLPLRC